MKQYIGFDSHKPYTLAEREELASKKATQCRIEHFRGAIRRYLQDCPASTAVAVQATARLAVWMRWEWGKVGHDGETYQRMGRDIQLEYLSV